MNDECGVLHPELLCPCRAPSDYPNHRFHMGGSPLKPVEWPNEAYTEPVKVTPLPQRKTRLLDLSKQLKASDRRREALARRDDPETSHEAARGLGDLTEAQEEVLSLFSTYGPMHDELVEQRAIERNIKQTPSGLRTRRAELVDAGMLIFTGRYTLNSLGNRSRVWSLLG